MTRFPSFWWMNNILACGYHKLSIHLPTDEHLGCSQLPNFRRWQKLSETLPILTWQRQTQIKRSKQEGQNNVFRVIHFAGSWFISAICFLWYSSYIILYKVLSHYHLKLINIMYFFPLKTTLKHFQENTVQQLVPIIIVKGILYLWFCQKCWILGSVQNSRCLGSLSTLSLFCSLIIMCGYGWDFACLRRRCFAGKSIN